jgi:hypothetical protein
MVHISIYRQAGANYQMRRMVCDLRRFDWVVISQDLAQEHRGEEELVIPVPSMNESIIS